MSHLKATSSQMVPAVSETVSGLPEDARDTAAIRLAQRYAREIDRAEDQRDALEKLGPKLLAVLTALGATPASRRSAVGGVARHDDSELSRLRNVAG